MTLAQIQDLIKFVSKSGVSEVEIEQKDFKINIKTPAGRKDAPVQVIAQPLPVAQPTALPAAAPAAAAPAAAPAAPAPAGTGRPRPAPTDSDRHRTGPNLLGPAPV